ncbi:hypothetical protein FHS86_001159 [Roseimarinus sediminis]
MLHYNSSQLTNNGYLSINKRSASVNEENISSLLPSDQSIFYFTISYIFAA